jgi:hypothetical protein
MKKKRIFYGSLSLLMSLILLSLMILPRRVKGETNQTAIIWSRTLEPVIIEGSQFPLFTNVRITNLWAYAKVNGLWEQIPLQIDEITSLGDYAPENGRLDSNDELVFMAKDLGQKVSVGDWIWNDASRNYPRYEIKVTNPINPAEIGYIYIYRSNTVTASYEDYVAWDPTNQVIASGTYTLGLSTADFIGVDSLKLNGVNVDILDRSKFRLYVTCKTGGNPVPILISEEFGEVEFPDFLELEADIDGPVRVGGGILGRSNWYYHAMRQNQFSIDFEVLKGIVCEIPYLNFDHINAFRYSFDWLNPVDTGMSPMIYYDNNKPSGVAINGVSDSVPKAPVNTWSQASGNLGSVVRVTDIDIFDATIENYYLDTTSDPGDDTGDFQSFGDSGYNVKFRPEAIEYGQLDIFTLEFILPPNQPNVGATYVNYKQNPLQVILTSQEFSTTYYFPLILK